MTDTQNGKNVRSYKGKMTKKRKNSDLHDEDKMEIRDKEFLIIQTQIMRLPLSEALVWLEVHGYKMEKTAYYEELGKISKKVDFRAMEIAKKGLLETHMKMIDTLVVCERQLWNNYHRLVSSPYKQAQVIKIIMEMQPYLTEAYDRTRVVMEKQAELRSRFSLMTDTE